MLRNNINPINLFKINFNILKSESILIQTFCMMKVLVNVKHGIE